MTYWRQPWGRLTVTGLRCRLQVLDPVTAFALEPELVERFGDHLLMALGAPRHVLGAMWSGVAGEQGFGGSFAEAIHDPEHGLQIAAAGLQRMAQMLIVCMAEARIDGPWVAKTFETMIFDRLEVGDQAVGDWDAWKRSGLGAEARWRLLAAQIEQTYEPIWTRSPYSVRSKEPRDLGVPVPNHIPIAEQWADALAVTGRVPSAHEAITSWTPERLLNAVDMAAQQAENERRAMKQAEAQSR